MKTFTMSQISGATRCSPHDVGNWSAKGWLSLPFANPARGKARRYGLANAYELALFRRLFRLGLPAMEIRARLFDRFTWIGVERALVLSEPYPGLDVFVHDAEKWLTFEFVERDLENAMCYVLTRDENSGWTSRLEGMHLQNVAELIKVEAAEIFEVVNVTRILAAVDHALIGTPMPYDPARVEGGFGAAQETDAE